MRIYMAAYYQNHKGRSANELVTSMAAPSHVLESYHYMDSRMEGMIRDKKTTVFLDSGAFSMFTQGIAVDLDAYAQWLKDNAGLVHVASNLDVIGRGNEEATYRNQKYLEGIGAKIQPVHHARDRDEWLQRYLDEGYDYIFLGGMVPETSNYLRDWLDHIWERYLCKPDGTPKVKVHGFGLTSLDLMFRYPWFSVDSTSWLMTSNFGSVYLDMPHRDYKIIFSDQSPKARDDNSWHFQTLKGKEKQAILDRLAQLETSRAGNKELEAYVQDQTGIAQGYTVEALTKMYGWRRHMNIDYFKRIQSRATTRFVREQEAFF